MFWSRQLSSSTSTTVTPNELLEILLAHTYGYYVLPQEPYDEVFPGIFLGDSTTALCIHLLKRLGITHVLNAAWGRQRNLGLVNTSEAFYRNAQINFMGIEALDMSVFPLYQHFHQAADFIEQAFKQPNGKILVHCGEGISRSSTLVIAYLMIKCGLAVQDAVRTVVKHRNILPNQGFLLQLCHLNDELLSSRSQNILPRQPLPSQHSQQLSPESPKPRPQSSNTNDDEIPTGGSSRSPTPITAITKPNFSLSATKSSPTARPQLNRNNFYRASSLAPSRTTNKSNYQNHCYGEGSTSSSSSFYNQNGSYSPLSSLNIKSNQISSNYNPPSSYPVRSSSIRPIENRLQMQRRTDFRRAQSVERPNYVTRGSSFLNRCSSTTPTPCHLYRSQFNISNDKDNRVFSNSLMTTYLINRPLPTISK